MNRRTIIAVGFAFMAVVGPAQAGVDPNAFSFTADGGSIPQFGTTEGFGNYPLFMDSASTIASLELVLNDLTHDHPQDLDIYLISPFGGTIEIMTDKGNGFAIDNLDLVFSDSGVALPDEGSALAATTYRPEDSTGPLPHDGFARYIGNAGANDAWELIIIDDSLGDVGSLGSFTLRGTFVPEPASLALLGLGGLAALRRSRRAS